MTCFHIPDCGSTVDDDTHSFVNDRQCNPVKRPHKGAGRPPVQKHKQLKHTPIRRSPRKTTDPSPRRSPKKATSRRIVHPRTKQR